MHPVVYIDMGHLCRHLPQLKQVTLGDATDRKNPVQKKATTAQYTPNTLNIHIHRNPSI
jgi:hypothetical protein